MAQAAHGFGHHAEAGFVAVGAGLAIAADTQDDQARVQRQQVVRPQAPAFHGTGAKVLDQHVCVCGQLPNDGLRLGAFQIQCQ